MIDINLKNTLFITEGNVDRKIPNRDDSFYILHNCRKMDKKNYIKIQTYTLDVLKKDVIPMEDNKYQYYSIKNRAYYMPWATDLLPHEIDKIKEDYDNIKKKEKRELNFVGTPNKEWTIFKDIVEKHDIKFSRCGGFSKNKATREENINLIQKSYISPAIQDKWQVEHGYIPCRIFKNISYGKMGITNNLTVYELFEKNIVYNSDLNGLLLDSIENKNNHTKEKQFKLMDFVKDKHTYLNRVNNLLKFISYLQID